MNENQRKPRKPIAPEVRAKAEAFFNSSEFWSSAGGCKIWSRNTDVRGYGRITIRVSMEERVYFGAHRLAYEMAHGEIPVGMFVCHKCDNRRCCNPDHLFLGSEQDNWLDMRLKHRHPRGDRHPHAKITEAMAAEIKWWIAKGERNCDVARRLNIDARIVSGIKLGANWKWVEPKAPEGAA